MGFYTRRVVPFLIRRGCATKGIIKHRAAMIPRTEGRVLEVGAGGGMNFAHYDQGRVSEVIGLDPSPELMKDAEAAARACGLHFRAMPGSATAIPLEAAEVDTVVCTFTLCSIPDQMTALSEMRRVLRPGGLLIFAEHGVAPEAKVRRMQDRLNPLWRRFAGGCNLNRDAPGDIARAGFRIEDLSQRYMARTPRFAGFVSRGVALRT